MAEQDLELSVGIGGAQAFNASLKSMEQAIESLTDSLDDLGDKTPPATAPLKDLPTKTKPVEGSIAAVSLKLKDLQSKFIQTGDALERSRLKEEMDGLNRELKEMSGAGGGGAATLPKATSSVSLFSSALSTLGITLGAAAVVGGIKQLGQAALKSAIDYESLSISLGVLLGDAEKVPGVLAEWKKFSDATPFEPEQVNKAGKALLAFGFESEQLIPLMTKIGDVAAGTGKDFNELATIYGKARVAGTLMSEDINQLTEAGIPIMEELAVVLGTSTDKVKKMASEGKITFPLFEQAFGRLTGEGGKFGGMMDKLSQSTEGILSTLKGEFDGLLREVGTAFLPMIKELATAAIPAIQNALVNLKPYLAELPKFFASVKETAMSIIDPIKRIYDAFMRLIQPFIDAGEGFRLFGGAMDAVMPRFDTIAWALDKLATALELVADAGGWVADTWNWAFGLADDEIQGLSNNSQVYIKEMTAFAQKEFGASAQQVQAFAKTLQASEFAGKSQAEAVQYMKDRFAVFIQSCNGATESTNKFGNAASDASKKALPAAGSIDYLNKKLKNLKAEFSATSSELQRSKLGEEIAKTEIAIESLTLQGDRFEGFTTKTMAVTDAMNKMALSTANMARPLEGFTESFTLDLETTTTAWERFQAKIGEGASGILKQGLEDLKASFRSFGVQAAESIGYAIGKASSAADAFKAVINSMLVEVPKLVGMVLLNAAVAAGPTPAGLALGAAGLALIGLSGLLGGIIEKNQEAKSALANSMSDLPTSATGATGAGSIGGLGGYTAASQQQAPVMVNVNAEMDGVQLGGLFKRVTTNYNKTTIKQR